MKKIINDKLYNTETATKLYDYDNGLYTTDVNYYSETLYKTKKGSYFLLKEGGAMSKMSKSNGLSKLGGMDIEAFSPEEAQDYLIEHQAIDVFEFEFGFLDEA
ncbi:hypothetical protein [Planomicrobium sp. CPCC 101079]|uniref:hypothetical protein n=1 Tax=Planomicrobium sp. CPCC 101079 TaxID=2599618 RepID=UPI0011B52B4B|nr:hypothetical protein [Planomicrobium sp. CPCC 101079]TWT00125.1 hypothetical protein FQV28_18580 [Planomicrobium sp. CPCC 101079]